MAKGKSHRKKRGSKGKRRKGRKCAAMTAEGKHCHNLAAGMSAYCAHHRHKH